MTVSELVQRIRGINQGGAELESYRAWRAEKKCPMCGGEKGPLTFCPECLSLMTKVKAEATNQGICNSCFVRPVAKAHSKSRYRGKVTRCLQCRQKERAEQDARQFNKEH